MNQEEIKKELAKLEETQDRNIVAIDYSNVCKWEDSLKWKIGIPQLSNLVKRLSKGKKFLRRFYYGSDYGPSDKSKILSWWSNNISTKTKTNGFEFVTKRVKYIHNKDYKYDYVKKCDLDIEIAIDLIIEKDNYDTVILFSGDGDFGCVLEYLKKEFDKKIIVFGARDHLGRELIDAKKVGVIDIIFYADDFEYRLDLHRFKKR